MKFEPRFTVLTLGVDNLEKSLKFYRDGLGLPTQGIIGTEFEHGAVIFFDLGHGMKLACYERKNIAWDSQMVETPSSPTEFTIGYNVRAEKEVDELMDVAKRAGARIARAAAKTTWGGYTGYFQDPDGHLWEVVWNPMLIPDRVD
jgi:uncharacterized protein